MSVTIKDIAKAAGVSYSTVSKALLDSPLVKPKTKAKIKEIALELGYQPNVAARSLVSKKSNTIGIVWPTVERVAHSALITAINQKLEEHAYTTLISINPLKDAIKTFSRFRVDGILVFDETSYIDSIETNVPVITYGIAGSTKQYPTVDVNRKAAIKAAVSYLHNIGHKKIAYIGNLTSEDLFQEEKVAGFTEAITEANLDNYEYSLLPITGLDQYDGYLAAKTIIKADRPTAFISGSQDLARGVFRAVHEMDLRIADDISIISYDNIPQKEDLDVPLSIVGVPLATIASTLCDLLIEVANGNSIDSTTILTPELHITTSCQPLP
ncbi:LacI family DNA-binding transcriptional regulator [Alkalihalobacillus sp. LMS39]|uniref:LacI family DNA-binding transcriptional regulator n=1 Tax=Alkalihalobacillus sp. LMS39 TaxID=2924032 RepID=UPI001FB24E74|nr:LacI family DNA-binding transcriptional regulator [Alkalihalobacillus sp. LMS39]UOE93595.1 LacI family transcriptional regulator [Alkalihalobacillus sp. LMS39]